MDKQNLQTLKGFRDFLPKEAARRNFVIGKIKEVFELYGFEPLETPALEYEELLLGKYGEEGDKLMYKFTDNGGRRVALRYDQTVPTARVLATYNQSLAMPWRRYQIQPVWRAENTQAGRYREFLQCDADVYGTTSPIADAEVIALANSIYQKLGFKDFTIYINDRRILFDLMNLSKIPENMQIPAISEIDKLDRRSVEEVSTNLKKLGISENSIQTLFKELEEKSPTDFLENVTKSAINLGVDSKALKFQARLARGLNYYTSTIFEIKVKGYDKGSVLGGGRYDNLISQLSGISIPAVGFAVGFDRTIEAMDELGLFSDEKARRGVLVSVFNPFLLEDSELVVANLRENNLKAEVYPDETKNLEKQLKYADKKDIKWFIVIGPDEVKKNMIILKNLETGEQEDIKLKDVVHKLQND